jgi:hypothetical protein
MNTKASCSNPACPRFGVQKSVALGRAVGYAAANDRITCPSCGNLMTTTETVNTSLKRPGKSRPRGTSYKRRPKQR